MYVVGLTGGIGSGKTVASDWFSEQGIEVVDADVVAREVVQVGQPALFRIQQQFGDWVLLENGELNRRALREHIFQHPEAKKILENITHPIIRESIIQKLEAAQSPYVILVSPLLFETEQTHLTQRNLLIDTPEHLQLERASQRDQSSHQHIQTIMSHQMPRHEKQRRADDIVMNDGQLSHLYAQLEPLHRQYLDDAKKTAS